VDCGTAEGWHLQTLIRLLQLNKTYHTWTIVHKKYILCLFWVLYYNAYCVFSQYHYTVFIILSDYYCSLFILSCLTMLRLVSIVTSRGSPTFCTPVWFCTLQYTRVRTKVIPWICRIVVLLAYLNCVVAPSDLKPNSLTSKCSTVAQTYPINGTFYIKWNGRNT
jgi:hypothetical protein